jgi:hypothetical protein
MRQSCTLAAAASSALTTAAIIPTTCVDASESIDKALHGSTEPQRLGVVVAATAPLAIWFATAAVRACRGQGSNLMA